MTDHESWYLQEIMNLSTNANQLAGDHLPGPHMEDRIAFAAHFTYPFTPLWGDAWNGYEWLCIPRAFTCFQLTEESEAGRTGSSKGRPGLFMPWRCLSGLECYPRYGFVCGFGGLIYGSASTHYAHIQ